VTREWWVLQLSEAGSDEVSLLRQERCQKVDISIPMYCGICARDPQEGVKAASIAVHIAG